MDDKRQIIRDKSVYKRKWEWKDELQFRWLTFLLKVSQKNILFCTNVRPKVEVLLVKHGFEVAEYEEGRFKIYK